VFQWIDLYTFNFAYVGSRTTGEKAGHYLFAGPHWNGETPPGIAKVFRSETDFVVALGRTALDGPADVKNVQPIQQQYKLTPLSAFGHKAPPPPVVAVSFPTWNQARATSIDFIAYLNFLLQFTQPGNPSETELMQRFAKIGIGAGKPFDAAKLDAPTREAIAQGVEDGKATDYHNAPLSVLDVLAPKRFKNGWGVGVVGGWVQQIGNDTGGLATLTNGANGNSVGLGPIVT
jgi:hypothetical protein